MYILYVSMQSDASYYYIRKTGVAIQECLGCV
jgi:hypothetical protein